jgi:hypothetical protein
MAVSLIVGVVGALLVLVLCASAFAFRKICRFPPFLKARHPSLGLHPAGAADWGKERHPTELNLQFEEVEIVSHDDGSIIRGWYFPVPKEKKSSGVGIVCTHGGGRDRRAFLRHTPFLIEKGHSVVILAPPPSPFLPTVIVICSSTFPRLPLAASV